MLSEEKKRKKRIINSKLKQMKMKMMMIMINQMIDLFEKPKIIIQVCLFDSVCENFLTGKNFVLLFSSKLSVGN